MWVFILRTKIACIQCVWCVVTLFFIKSLYWQQCYIEFNIYTNEGLSKNNQFWKTKLTKTYFFASNKWIKSRFIYKTIVENKWLRILKIIFFLFTCYYEFKVLLSWLLTNKTWILYIKEQCKHSLYSSRVIDDTYHMKSFCYASLSYVKFRFV